MAARAKSTTSRIAAKRVFVALLRGINVGGKHTLSMPELARLFEGAGCAAVRTYIQSGNVVFTATPACAKRVPRVVADGIARRFGFTAPVILRTADELGHVAAGNPFEEAGAEERSLHVVFLSTAPDRRQIAALDPQRSSGDEFVVRSSRTRAGAGAGGEIYLRLPNGVAKTRLTNSYFDSALGTTSTLRNWRTVLKLLEMARQVS